MFFEIKKALHFKVASTMVSYVICCNSPYFSKTAFGHCDQLWKLLTICKGCDWFLPLDKQQSAFWSRLYKICNRINNFVRFYCADFRLYRTTYVSLDICMCLGLAQSFGASWLFVVKFIWYVVTVLVSASSSNKWSELPSFDLLLTAFWQKKTCFEESTFICLAPAD